MASSRTTPRLPLTKGSNWFSETFFVGPSWKRIGVDSDVLTRCSDFLALELTRSHYNPCWHLTTEDYLIDFSFSIWDPPFCPGFWKACRSLTFGCYSLILKRAMQIYLAKINLDKNLWAGLLIKFRFCGSDWLKSLKRGSTKNPSIHNPPDPCPSLSTTAN